MDLDLQLTQDALERFRKSGWSCGREWLTKALAAPRDPLLASERLSAPAEARDELAAWLQVSEAGLALQRRHLAEAHELLDGVSRVAAGMNGLQAAVAHVRGALLHHQGRRSEALSCLHDALEMLGAEHSATGPVLDTLGMVYASLEDYQMAREFYLASLVIKERQVPPDQVGVALTHGQLGRLELDWGYIEKAEEELRKDLELAWQMGDLTGEAQMYNHLGQVARQKGDLDSSLDYLDQAISLSEKLQNPIAEGFARKDKALTCLLGRKVEQAGLELDRAEELFRQQDFAEGLAHVARARAEYLRTQERLAESENALRFAAEHFQNHGEAAELARTLLELARTCRAAKARSRLVCDAYARALRSAERCRRPRLIALVEAELREVDEVYWLQHIFRRVRGRGLDEGPLSLVSGTREEATVIFLDLVRSTDFVRAQDPETVMMTLNQLMADLSEAAYLQEPELRITQYLGDGFLAHVRGPHHPLRAVRAACAALERLRECNRPRQILGLRPVMEGRVGVCTGEVVFANVGTYAKMDFTAVGSTTHQAARLQSVGQPGRPCLSRSTFERVSKHVRIAEGSPRKVELKGFGEQEVWDVEGLAAPDRPAR